MRGRGRRHTAWGAASACPWGTVSTTGQPGASVRPSGACSTEAKGHHPTPPATPDTAHGYLDFGLKALSFWGGSSCSIHLFFFFSLPLQCTALCIQHQHRHCSQRLFWLCHFPRRWGCMLQHEVGAFWHAQQLLTGSWADTNHYSIQGRCLHCLSQLPRVGD